MSKSLKAAIYETHGIPAEVLRIVDQPWPAPKPDEVVVRMAAAPINPADLNAIEGKYPVRPPLPATPGMEGAGVVVELGSAVRDLDAGTLVILPHGLGTWREACAVAAEKLVAVPQGIEPIQAAMLKVNPITAWRMLHDFVPLQPGDWLIQNAANSAAGRAVIQIARELGYKTINIVRRSELAEELRALGGDVVLLDGDDLRDEVVAATERAPIRLALNAVGGESAVRMAKSAGAGGNHRDLRRDELAADVHSERHAHFQEPPLHGFLGKQMVRRCDSEAARGNLCAALRNGATRAVAHEGGKDLSACGDEGRRGTRVAREAGREDRVHIRSGECHPNRADERDLRYRFRHLDSCALTASTLLGPSPSRGSGWQLRAILDCYYCCVARPRPSAGASGA